MPLPTFVQLFSHHASGQAPIVTRELSLRPALIVFVVPSRVPICVAWCALFFAFAMLLVPTAQLAWWAKALIGVFAITGVLVEIRKFRINTPRALRVTPHDEIEVRRRYAKSETETFESVDPCTPLFVSPGMISFSTKRHGRIVLFADQVEIDDWRALRVRLNHLRTIG
jgi:hypothetical protein